ncbi:MAG: hypothetical protein LBB74_01445 [Chitinispirillales bacterium]|jgi:hypothetical protein|nr:hypothetical protein [Chitinispirillales bacterium]
MGSFEDRLQRLKSVDISNDCKTEACDSAPPPPSRPAPDRGGQKRELSDKAANLIATTLKSFLRD